MELKITSLNVQGFDDWQLRKPKITEYLQQQDPDIILLQEVTYIPELHSETQTSILNKTLQYPFEHSSVARLQKGLVYETYREGLSVLSKLPISKSEVLALKKDPEDEHLRLIQLIDMPLDNGDVLKLANIHLSITDFTEKYAREQLKEILEILDSRDEKRIIAGDFNMNDLDLHADLWGESYTPSSIVPLVTYPSENKCVDYFLIPKEFDFLDVAVSPDGISDHRALTISVNALQSQYAEAQTLWNRPLTRSK